MARFFLQLDKRNHDVKDGVVKCFIFLQHHLFKSCEKDRVFFTSDSKIIAI